MVDYLTIMEEKDNHKLKNNYWDSKPLWCKPWSIILTGILIDIFSYEFIQYKIIYIPIIIFISIWWFLFLIIIPSAYNKITID